MSPTHPARVATHSSFPRVSGDEPGNRRLPEDYPEFSPRERG